MIGCTSLFHPINVVIFAAAVKRISNIEIMTAGLRERYKLL